MVVMMICLWYCFHIMEHWWHHCLLKYFSFSYLQTPSGSAHPSLTPPSVSSLLLPLYHTIHSFVQLTPGFWNQRPSSLTHCEGSLFLVTSIYEHSYMIVLYHLTCLLTFPFSSLKIHFESVKSFYLLQLFLWLYLPTFQHSYTCIFTSLPVCLSLYSPGIHSNLSHVPLWSYLSASYRSICTRIRLIY